MKDFVKKYQELKLISNVNIILVSLVLALIINLVFIDGTQVGQNLKASVLNSNQNTSISNLYVVQNGDFFGVNVGKNLSQMTTLSFSVAYNPENISLSNIESSYGDITNISNEPGINLLLLTTSSSTNLKKGDEILKFKINKLNGNTVENINLMNANFKDSNNNQFFLSTSGITF